MKTDKVQVKICGIKSEQEIQMLNHYPVDFIGLIFAKSKRQLSIEQAEHLRTQIRSDIQVVGVFMNNEYDFIENAIRQCDLDIVQLHGDESDELIKKVKQLGVKVWKAIGVKEETSSAKTKNYPSADGILFDAYHEGESGGTGHTFNWQWVKGQSADYKIILAGGLNPENIMDAIEAVKPDIVDLNSGLEVDLYKNELKVKALFDTLINRVI